ncbi:MAG: biotin--[acetyl-CoA-carboxylase] ligase [Flavisolibacter sp.]
MSSSNPLGAPFLELPTVDSTNNYAMGMVRAGMAHHGMAVFTMEQTSGKGQRDKSWISEPGQNIALTLVIEPQTHFHALFLLSMAIAEGTVRFFRKYVEDDVSIKWPNDLYWRDRKAGGILIENVWQGGIWKFAVVGIGININQTRFDLLTPAVSMKQITGKDHNPSALAKELCVFLDHSYHEAVENPDELKKAYRNDIYQLNEKVKLKKGSRIFEARILNVTDDGKLLVYHGTEEKFDVGEVEWVM